MLNYHLVTLDIIGYDGGCLHHGSAMLVAYLLKTRCNWGQLSLLLKSHSACSPGIGSSTKKLISKQPESSSDNRSIIEVNTCKYHNWVLYCYYELSNEFAHESEKE